MVAKQLLPENGCPEIILQPPKVMPLEKASTLGASAPTSWPTMNEAASSSSSVK